MTIIAAHPNDETGTVGIAPLKGEPPVERQRVHDQVTRYEEALICRLCHQMSNLSRVKPVVLVYRLTMLMLFIQHPLWWAIPAAVTFVILVICARFLKETRLYKGENELMRQPIAIMGMSLMWPLTVTGVLVWCVFRLADVIIRPLIR